MNYSKNAGAGAGMCTAAVAEYSPERLASVLRHIAGRKSVAAVTATRSIQTLLTLMEKAQLEDLYVFMLGNSRHKQRAELLSDHDLVTTWIM